MKNSKPLALDRPDCAFGVEGVAILSTSTNADTDGSATATSCTSVRSRMTAQDAVILFHQLSDNTYSPRRLQSLWAGLSGHRLGAVSGLNGFVSTHGYAGSPHARYGTRAPEKR